MIEPQIIDRISVMIEREEKHLKYLQDFRDKYGRGADNFIDGLIRKSEEMLSHYRQRQQEYSEHNLKQEHGK